MATRRLSAILAIIVLEAGLVVGLSGVAYAQTALAGTVTCSPFSGSGHFNHSITTTGTASSMRIHYTGTLSGCVGTFGVYSITSGTVTATGHFIGSDVNRCSNFEGPYPSGLPADTIRDPRDGPLDNVACTRGHRHISLTVEPSNPFWNLTKTKYIQGRRIRGLAYSFTPRSTEV